MMAAQGTIEKETRALARDMTETDRAEKRTELYDRRAKLQPGEEILSGKVGWVWLSP